MTVQVQSHLREFLAHLVNALNIFIMVLSDDLLIFNQKSLNIVNLRHNFIVIYCFWLIKKQHAS